MPKSNGGEAKDAPQTRVDPDERTVPKAQNLPLVTHNRKHSWLEKLAVAFAALAFTASAWQGWVARDTEKRQLHAYILPSESSVVLSPPNNLKMHLVVKNFGSTPAYKLVGWNCIIVGRFKKDSIGNLGFETEFPVPPFDEKNAQQTTVGPQDTKSVLSPSFCDGNVARVRAITPEEFARIQNGNAAVYIYGEQHYLDAFGTAHFTNYRMVGLGGGGTFDTLDGNDSD